MHHYCYAFDSMYDSNTLMFIEPVCSDSECNYCNRRPENHAACNNERCKAEIADNLRDAFPDEEEIADNLRAERARRLTIDNE